MNGEVTHAGIAVVARDTGRVLLQQRAWDPDDPEEVRGTWEWPGGSLEADEEPQEGAWREFREETGLPVPEGEVVNGWKAEGREGHVYQGFVFAVPVEAEAFPELNPDREGADTINPDDPERANPDITAWFTVEQARGLGEALRPEVREMDWSIFDLEEDMAEKEPRRWFGVLAPEGVRSGDRRMFTPGALRMRALPLPLTWQKVASSGHSGNVVTGIIQEVWRDSRNRIWGAGEYLDTPEADEHWSLVERFGRYGVSIDADDLDEYAIEMDEDGVTVFTDARVCSTCAVSIPAFAEAWMMNGNYEDFARDFAGGWGAPSQQIPTRESEGQAECEERDEDGNCIERDDEERNDMAAAVEGCVGCEAEEPGEPEPCDPENDPDCVADDEHLPEKEKPSGEFKDYSPEARRKMAGKEAMDDGSFPIADCDDLRNAIQAIGRASDPDKAKAHIRKRKSALGCEDVELPDTWAASTVETECADCVKDIPFEEWNGNPVEGIAASADYATTPFKDLAPGLTEDGPGWLTHPVDTDRLRDYWVRGPGAAKIAWGTPGDFDRCRAQVAKYVKPQFLAGYCANRHYDALGFWPGQAPHKGEAIAMTAMQNGVEVGTEETETAEVESLTAGAPMKNPPKEWFTDPGLPGVTPLTITNEGRVFGHLATWGQCHIGIGGECVMLPRSASDYSYFHIGVIETDGGEVFTGPLVMGGKHAPERLDWRAATRHYDTTSAVVADVRVGEDEFGVWMSGALRDGVTEEQIRELKAAGKASGDWREVVRGSRQLELVAALAVNVGGFPVPRTSAGVKDGRVVSLLAAGIVEDDPIGEIAEEVMARIEAKREVSELAKEVYGPEIEALREEIETEGGQ